MGATDSDTDPKIAAMQIEGLRAMPPWRRMQLMLALTASARTLAMAGLRRRFPAASQQELRRRLAGLLYGEDLAGKVYGDLES